jgi:hypothetical protein
MRPLAIIGNQYQAGGVDIQSAGDMKIAEVFSLQQVHHGLVVTIFGGGDHAYRLVQHDVALPAQGKRSAVQCYLIVFRQDQPGITYGLAIYLQAFIP